MTDETTPRPASLPPAPVATSIGPAPQRAAVEPRRIPTPAGLRPQPTEGAAPPARASDPARFGRVAADGTAYLRTPEGEVVVGLWAAGTPEEGLAFFGRKYDDLMVELDLAAFRLREGRGRPDQARSALDHARAALAAPAFIGDVVEMATLCDEVEGLIATARAAQDEARTRQRAAALARREEIVAEAEALASTEPAATRWKPAGERFVALLEEWKTAPHADRAAEQALWKRFSTARTRFDRARRQHFAAQETERKEAIAAKEALIAEAEALSTSTDWAGTTRDLRRLMDRWKATGHAGKRDEDRLWKRFRAAQDAFFAARETHNAGRRDEETANLERKEALVAEAEAISVSDPKAARRALRGIQERWESIGHVPRADRERVEGRLRRVETTIRDAEQSAWQRSNPETRARVEDTVGKFQAAVDRAEAALADAEAGGDPAAVQAARDALDSTRALMAAAQGALSDPR